MSAELDRVREYRKAARLAVQADYAELKDRYLALLDLAEYAREETDPLTRTWAERVIWEESKVFLGVDDDPLDFPPDEYESAQRRVRAEGFERCPKCKGQVASEGDRTLAAAPASARANAPRPRAGGRPMSSDLVPRVSERLGGLRSRSGLGDLLDEIECYLRRFVSLTSSQAIAIALWVVHTYAIEAAELTPYLNVYSAVKRSGKTLLLDVLAVLVHQPMLAADMTAAVLFRVVDELKPTLLFDEVDVIFGGKGERADEIRGLLNAGYKRGGAAWRMEMSGRSGVARSFDVFGAKALAGIGKLPDTIEDRSIPLALARKVRGIDMERFRMRGKLEETAPLREAVAVWVEDHLEHLAAARPELPDKLNDRQQDVWEPLLAIADAAGHDWPARARAAARELHGDGDEAESSTALLLLLHLRDLFADLADAVALSTAMILSGLVDNDDGPWAEWWSVDTDHAKRSAASGLARMLRPFGISSTKVKLDGVAVRGYRRESFLDAWTRYLPKVDGTDATDGTSQVAPTSTVPLVPQVPSTLQDSDAQNPDWRRVQREAGEEPPESRAEAFANIRTTLPDIRVAEEQAIAPSRKRRGEE